MMYGYKEYNQFTKKKRERERKIRNRKIAWAVTISLVVLTIVTIFVTCIVAAKTTSNTLPSSNLTAKEVIK